MPSSTPENGSEPRGGAFGTELPPVGFAETLDAFGIVRGWLDRGSVPELDGTRLPSAWVASVMVRYEDRLVGQDTAVATTPDEAIGTLREAAARAISRAAAQLQGPPDALRPDRLARNLARTRLSIELSVGDPTPVASGVTAAELDNWLRPGLEGMLLGREGFYRARTPAQMLMTGSRASATLVTLVAELADDPSAALSPFDELAESGYELSFFRVSHAAQTAPTSPPLVLHRGGAVVPAMRTPELAAVADRIAAHIRSRAWPGVEKIGLRDGLDPVSGRFATGGASPFAQALAAEALLRYAATDGVDEAERVLARDAGHEILGALAVVEGSERAPWGDAVTAAACINALAMLDRRAIERSSELRGLRDRCMPVVGDAFGADGFDTMVPPGARGVVARALVALASFEPWERDAHLARAQEAIRTAYRDTPESGLLNLMPDLALADISLASEVGGEPVSAAALRALRTRLLDLQLDADDLVNADRDLAGGFVLDANGSPLPTWHSTRPTALLATMLGDPALTRGTLASGEVLTNLLELAESLRFVAQLTAGERLTHMYADTEQSLGGVRASLWDQSMPLTASALGLIAVTESLDSMRAVQSRNGATATRP